MNDWTHWFSPIICFELYAERCRIIKRRGGILGAMFGNVKIETDQGYTGWQSEGELYEIPEED